jgi:uncharacterized membrane protein YoaK (UPF0700 family)
VLTFTTGLVDAVSYLGLGRVFAANMTGNVVLLGFGVAGAGGLPVVSPLVSLCAFLAGGIAGGRLAARLAHDRRVHVARALAIEVALIAVTVALAASGMVHADRFSGNLVIGLLAFAMGLRNATVRRLGVPDLSTTVLTMTLTGLAADSPLAGHDGAGTLRRGGAVVAMFAGAVAGALLLRTSLTVPLAAAALLALATWILYARATEPAG